MCFHQGPELTVLAPGKADRPCLIQYFSAGPLSSYPLHPQPRPVREAVEGRGDEVHGFLQHSQCQRYELPSPELTLPYLAAFPLPSRLPGNTQPKPLLTYLQAHTLLLTREGRRELEFAAWQAEGFWMSHLLSLTLQIMYRKNRQ